MKLSKYGFNIALALLLMPGIAHAVILDPEISGTSSCYHSLNGTVTNGNCSANTLDYLGTGKWGIVFPYGEVSGKSVCASTGFSNSTIATVEQDTTLDSVYNAQVENPDGLNNSQLYCWCKIENPNITYWVSGNRYSSMTSCRSSCAAYCASARNSKTIRARMFEAFKEFTGTGVTTQPYVDTAVATRQNIITTTGTNKLMTFGSSAGNVGSRDIVSTLGTSTTETTIPEVGSIVVAINNKQNKLSAGTADSVMTGTGTAGRLGEKPVYSATNNYSNALVTAQTINTAAMDAANGEMSCHSYVSGQSETPENCLLWAINQSAPSGLSTATLVTSVNGTSYCGRTLDGVAHSSNGTCGADTLSYLGELDSKNGKWGAVFPYGDVSGISVCSNIDGGTIGTVATDEQTTTLNSQYTSQANGGSVAGQYCWCKMENPVASRWVFKQSGRSANECKYNCPNNCASSGSPSGLVRNESFRIAVFGALE